MQQTNKQWLPHLQDSVPLTVSADRLSIHAIALEGWRRGLILKFYNEKRKDKVVLRYSLLNDNKEVRFSYSTGPDVTKEARKITSNKTLTKEYLKKVGVPVPEGKKFDNQSNEEIINYVSKNINFPVVLKPSSGKMGKGVIANITDIEELEKSLKVVREELRFQSVIVEEYVPGEEYRIYVIDGKVIGAMNRIPANVVGDGNSTIKDLIKKKNRKRRNIPSVRRRPIKIDAEVRRNVKKYNYTLQSIPLKDEQVLLRKNSNVSSGGDPIDVTDLLSDEIKKVAVNAVKSIPGLVESGVDLIVDERSNIGKIIELNTNVGLAGHLFPLEGKARDIPKAIIDYYFPDTKNITTDLYFDFTKVTALLNSGTVEEIIMPVIEKEPLFVKALIVSGKVQKVNYENWIQKRALYFDLNGFVENRTDGTVLIVIGGTESTINNFENYIRENGPLRAGIESVEEKEWNIPIEVGFQIINNDRENAIEDKKGIKKKINQRKVDGKSVTNSPSKENKIIEQELDNLKKENELLLNSTSWKITKPIRKISSLIKKGK